MIAFERRPEPLWHSETAGLRIGFRTLGLRRYVQSVFGNGFVFKDPKDFNRRERRGSRQGRRETNFQAAGNTSSVL